MIRQSRENEIGMLPDARDYSDAANPKIARSRKNIQSA